MQLTFGPVDLSESSLRYLKQIGVDHVQIYAPTVPGYLEKGYLDLSDLLSVKRHVESCGLYLSTVILDALASANVVLDRPDWKKDLDHICRSIESVGRASIPILMHNLLASRAIRDATGQPLPGYWDNPDGRGGAVIRSFDEERARQVTDRPAGSVSAEQMWERIIRFQERCVPVAHEARVRLTCHPDDPPVACHWGVTQVLNSIEGLNRLIEIVPSEYSGIVLCVGTLGAAGADVIEAIRFFGAKKKIFNVGFRNVRGTIPRYEECFMDEGDLDMYEVIQTLKEVDYQWMLQPEHVPGVIGDPKPGHNRTAITWTVGYIKGLLAALNSPSSRS